MSKKVLAFVMMVCMCLSTTVFAQGSEVTEETTSGRYYYISSEDGVEALSVSRYSVIYKVGIGLTISNRVALVYAECKTYYSSNIGVKAELQRLDSGSWTTVKTFSSSASDAKISSIEGTYAVTSGYAYRVKVTVSTTYGSTTESDVLYGNTQICY